MQSKKRLKNFFFETGILLIVPLIAFSIFYILTTFPSYWIESLSYKNHVASERPYEWYYDQNGTGSKSNTNCAPTSIAMAAKWQDESFSTPISTIRNTYAPENTDGMTLDELRSALEGLGLVFETKRVVHYDELKDVIDSNNIAIVCVDMEKVSFKDQHSSAIGRYYKQGSHHAIIVKGYLYLDDVMYYEVYDPYQGIKVYPNNQPKSKDRLYPAKELYKAMRAFDREYFVILDKTPSR